MDAIFSIRHGFYPGTENSRGEKMEIRRGENLK